jgi:glutamate dehydrogenase
MYEIFVQSPQVHGVHLRFGPVARGGLRWSDRDDFRTEVVGLATTQQVKNVVIVPTGSKGGFLLKRPERDPAARRQQADELYKTFIKGMLDITDNNVGGQIVHPPRVVHHDGGDPYLVVAADKGTAHLSDTANAISESYGFWLGDAFASGGSNGYDHKKVGITARGAWVLVRRHFAEHGIDPYREPFTCVGVGDMGGDVFGNGLIESKATKLLAAFNHLHIFLDPDPDPATSWEERKRLFDTQGGWDRYDASVISEGGGVFDRRAKSVPLSTQAQEMLGLPKAEAKPEEVIQAILKMKVDLFWNGGIGTYVKASWETDADADDRSNDAVRIDANELRVRIVGEGGNLGFTQQARIEADLCGVSLNTDAIDNSGGVDMSDHEVNLKILLNQVVARGDLSVEQRNQLLEEMTEEVAGLVLADNDAHGRQLSRDKIRSQSNVFQFGRAIAFVERAFGRDRSTLNLPTDEALAQRASEGKGLTRPELAVLSAWVKMYIKRELMAGDPKALPRYRHLLHTYFPQRVQETYPDDIDQHMLADEIAVTVATTNMVADAGAAFFPMCIEATGASVQSIAEAYLKAQHLAYAHEVRGTLEELRTTVSLSQLYKAWVQVDKGVQEVALYWLSTRAHIPPDDLLDEMREAAAQVYDLQATEVLDANRQVLEDLLSSDIPEEVARPIVRAQFINLALTVWAESKSSGTDFASIAVRHLAIGRASRLQEVLDSLTSRPASGRWDPIALRILHTRFHNLLRRLVGAVPVDADNLTVDELEPVLAKGVLADVRAQVNDLLDGEEAPSIATLLVLMERLDAALARMTDAA